MAARAWLLAVVAAGLTLAAVVPAASAPGTGSPFGADVGAAWHAGAAESMTAPAAARRCRTVARKRFARIRRGSLAKPARLAARRRVKAKLARCLTAARLVTPTLTPGGPAPQPPSPTPPTGPGTPPPSLPGFVSATASDDDGFRLTLSRPAVAAGSVTVELRNSDRGPHDLVIEPDGGGETARFDPLAPDTAPVRKTIALPAGRWRLYCSLGDHAAQGMEATLRAE